MKVINRLKTYDNGIVADNSIEPRESRIFKRKYPGRNRVRRIDERYLSQFINGMLVNSRMEPSQAGTKKTASMQDIVRLMKRIFGK